MADAIKAPSKKAIQKTTEATGDLTGNKIADKSLSSKTQLKQKTQKFQTKDIYHPKIDNKLLMS